MIKDPAGILAYLLTLIALIYYLNSLSGFKRFFHFLPTVIWVYFLPMFSTTLGIIPDSSPLYTWVKLYFLPAALVLLLISVDLPSLARLGPKAIGTMLTGTLGVVVGASIAFLIFGHWLPPDAWKGLGALSGSWIGGSSNMVAIGESINTREDLFGIMIIVDTVIGYGWMGIVIAFSGFQEKIDRWNGVDTSYIKELNARINDLDTARRRPLTFVDLSLMVAISFGIGYISYRLGLLLPPVGDVLTSFGWTIIIVSILGIGLSFTRLSELEYSGASHVGNIFLYLLLATIGAKADLKAITTAPLFLLVGIVWIAIHGVILFFGGKLLKSPMFLIATSSQANIGGVVSAPIVATVYQKSLAPVGLLMGVLGNILGLYFGLLTAQILSWIAKIYW